ncbi:MAG: hypothetical protein WC544_05065 [Patescibacteria group bacterium]
MSDSEDKKKKSTTPHPDTGGIVRDSVEQAIEEYMPELVGMIRGLIKRSDKFMSAELAFAKFMPYISIAIGRLIPDDQPYSRFIDNVRTRFFAEYRRQVNLEHSGKSDEKTAKPETPEVKREKEKVASDVFATFVFMLPPDQVPKFLSAIDSLGEKSRLELRKMIGSIHPKQLQDVVKRLSVDPKFAGKYDRDYWLEVLTVLDRFSQAPAPASAPGLKSIADTMGEVQVLILGLSAANRSKILLLLEDQKNPEEYHRLLLLLSKLGPQGLKKLAALDLKDQKTFLGLAVLPEHQKKDPDWLDRQIEKFTTWRAEGRERDRVTGQKLANQAVKVVEGDPRLSGIVPLFKGLAELFEK